MSHPKVRVLRNTTGKPSEYMLPFNRYPVPPSTPTTPVRSTTPPRRDAAQPASSTASRTDKSYGMWGGGTGTCTSRALQTQQCHISPRPLAPAARPPATAPSTAPPKTQQQQQPSAAPTLAKAGTRVPPRATRTVSKAGITPGHLCRRLRARRPPAWTLLHGQTEGAGQNTHPERT